MTCDLDQNLFGGSRIAQEGEVVDPSDYVASVLSSGSSVVEPPVYDTLRANIPFKCSAEDISNVVNDLYPYNQDLPIRQYEGETSSEFHLRCGLMLIQSRTKDAPFYLFDMVNFVVDEIGVERFAQLIAYYEGRFYSSPSANMDCLANGDPIKKIKPSVSSRLRDCIAVNFLIQDVPELGSYIKGQDRLFIPSANDRNILLSGSFQALAHTFPNTSVAEIASALNMYGRFDRMLCDVECSKEMYLNTLGRVLRGYLEQFPGFQLDKLLLSLFIGVPIAVGHQMIKDIEYYELLRRQ